MKIYFDDLLIDENGYAGLTKTGTIYNESFVLGSTVCETFKLTLASDVVNTNYPGVIKIYEDDVLKHTLYVDSFEEDDTTVTFSLTDSMIKFNFPYDASPLIEAGETTLLDIFKNICLKAKISTNIESFYGDDIVVTWYDNTVTGRDYLGYIAELNASNLYIDENNMLVMKKVKQNAKEISFNYIENYKIGLKHLYTRVVWDNGVNYWEKGELIPAGKNKFDYVDSLKSENNNLKNVINDDGSITTTGKPTENYTMITGFVDVLPYLEDNTEYTLSQEKNDKIYLQMNAQKKDGTVEYLVCTEKLTFTVNKTLYSHLYLDIQTGKVTDWGDEELKITNKYMLSKGTDTVFEPYISSETYYINTNNVYVLNEETVQHIYDEINGFEFYNFESSNIPFDNIKVGDIVNFIDDSKKVPTIVQYSDVTYSGDQWFGGISISLLNEKQEETKIINNDEKIKALKIIVDRDSNRITETITETTKISKRVDENTTEINNNYQEIIKKFGDVVTDSEFINFKESMQTELDSQKFEISNIQSAIIDGVEYVKNTSGTFDKDGLTMSQTGAKTKTILNQDGVDVKDTQGSSNEDLLFAGYVSSDKARDNEEFAPYEGQTIVYTKNIIVKNYLSIGTHSRIEDFEDGTGVFYIGG